MIKRPANRFAWVDMARGLCIVAVVCLYARNDLARLFAGAGWLEPWAAFARPFRMPDFFLLSGLFLSAVIDRPWKSYLDTKVAHYAYFLLLWVSLIFAYDVLVLANSPDALASPVKFIKLWVWGLLYPDYMLWFIQTLPMFFVVTRLLRGVPKALLWSVAAAAMAASPKTGIHPIDNFADYYVFFLTGHLCARWIFKFADLARAHRARTAVLFVAWCFVNQWAVSAGLSAQPGLDLAFGFLGITAIIGLSTLLAPLRAFAWLSHAGANSIVVYLGFFIPLTLCIRFAWALQWPVGIDTLATLAVLCGVGAPLLLFHLTRATPLRFLFVRPKWAHLASSARHRGGPGAPAAEAASPSLGSSVDRTALPLRVTCRPLAEHPELEFVWRELSSRSSCSFFLTWPWIGSWLEQLPPRCDARVLLAHCGNRTVGAAVLVRTKRRIGPIPICDAWHLHSSGDMTDDSLWIEHNDFLIDSEHGDDVRSAMIAAWSALAGSAAELHLPGLAAAALPAARLGRLRSQDTVRQSAIVDLEAVRAAAMDFTSVLSSHARRFVRRSLKEYRTLGPVEVDTARTLAEALDFLAALTRLHAAVWQSRGQNSAFAGPGSLEFHKRLIKRALAQGGVQLLRVRAGTTPIGYLYSFIRAKRVFVYQSGFDYGVLEKHSRPGLVAHTLAIQHNAALGMDCYDLLAGESQYKATLATATEPMTWSVLQMPALRLSAEQVVRDAVWRWRRLMAS
ncbi:MAG: GNAT family N-acetyltransferase [Burkholderiaceae bacterium]